MKTKLEKDRIGRPSQSTYMRNTQKFNNTLITGSLKKANLLFLWLNIPQRHEFSSILLVAIMRIQNCKNII